MLSAISARLQPNSIKGGDFLQLIIEGFANPKLEKELLNQSCTIEFYEIDGLKSAKKSKNDDLLAEFSAKIVSQKPPLIGYELSEVKRVDSFEHELPKPEKRKNTDGEGKDWPLSFSSQWKPPHFRLSPNLLSSPAPVVPPIKAPDEHIIFIQGDSREREHYIYDIAVRILVGGKEKFFSRKFPTRLDCSNLLAHNCAEATKQFLHDHQELVKARGIGTNYGSRYVFPDETKFKADKAKYRLTSSNCIVYLLEACELAHRMSASLADWKRIKSHMKDGTGPTLAKGLEEVGWLGLYFNQDVAHPFDLDWSLTRKWARGHHRYSFQQVRKYGNYGTEKLKVKDLIINYRPTTQYAKYEADKIDKDFGGSHFPGADKLNGQPIATKDQTKKESVKIDKLKKVPFGLVNAKDGLHTAVIVYGDVYEVHWDKGPDDQLLYEATNFENDWGWISGIIHVPPGHW